MAAGGVVNFEVKRQFLSFLTMYMELEDAEEQIMLSLIDEEDSDRIRLLMLRFCVRDEVPKIPLYCEDTLAGYYAYQYKEIFRMLPETINKLVDELRPFYADPSGHGRAPVPLHKQVLLFMSHLAKNHIFRDNAEKFGISMSTAHGIVYNICNLIVDNLESKYIKWPDENRQRETAVYYEELRGFPGVIGSIDGTHIFIKAPKLYQSDYFDRHRCHSIKLQATCDELNLFTSIDAGYPGRAHDSRVFEDGELWFEDGDDISDFFHSADVHLLGDSGYPLKQYLLTPWKDLGALTPGQKLFNKKLSSCRASIECAFGILKGRYKKLKFMDVNDPARARELVRAACILHNFGILNGDELDPSEIDRDEDDDNGNSAAVLTQDALGAQKRQRIMRTLQNNN